MNPRDLDVVASSGSEGPGTQLDASWPSVEQGSQRVDVPFGSHGLFLLSLIRQNYRSINFRAIRNWNRLKPHLRTFKDLKKMGSMFLIPRIFACTLH